MLASIDRRAYEGTSVGTQTRVTGACSFKTRPDATLAALPAGSVATPDQTLQFTVTAGTTTWPAVIIQHGGSLG